MGTRRTWVWLQILVIVFSSSAGAQPKWVKESMDDFRSAKTEKQFGALILNHTSDYKIGSNRTVTGRHRLAMAITGAEGSDRAVFSFVVNSMVRVTDFKGWRLRPTGNVTTLSSRDLVQIAMPADPGEYYEDRVTLARFEHVSMGDIVAYEWTEDNKDTLTSGHLRFVFQEDLPVLKARVAVGVPPEWEIDFAGRGTDAFRVSTTSGGWAMSAENLPGRAKEGLSLPSRQLSRIVHIVCFDPANSTEKSGSWARSAAWARRALDEAAAPDDSIRAVTTAVVGSMTGNDERVKAIAEFVQREIRYVALEIGPGRFVPRDATAVLRKRYGDCKDKATLMRAMLATVGIPSVAVLASATDSVLSSLPSPFQFNHCIVGIPKSTTFQPTSLVDASVSDWTFFDPTDEATPWGKLPLRLSGSAVLPCADEATISLVELPTRSPEENSIEFRARAELDSAANISMACTVLYCGAASYTRKYLETTISPEQRNESLVRSFASGITRPVVSDYRVRFNNDTTEVALRVSGVATVSRAGNMVLLKANLFRPDQPMVTISGERSSPLYFGEVGKVTTKISWVLDSGWQVRDTPDPIVDSCSIASICQVVDTAGQDVTITTIETYTGAAISAPGFAGIGPFVRKRGELLGARLALARR